MKKNKIAIIIILVLASLLFLGSRLFLKDEGNKERISLDKLYGLKGDEAKLFIDTEEAEEKAFVVEKRAYIEFDLAKTMLNRLFYEEENELILYTDATSKTEYTLNAKDILVNGEKKQLDYIPFLTKDEEVFVALDFIDEKFDIHYEVTEAPFRVLLFIREKEYTKARALKEEKLRMASNKEAEIVADVEKGDALWVLNDTENEDYTKVMTEGGIPGYIRKKSLSNYETAEVSFERKDLNAGYKSKKREEPIVLGWHQVFNANANFEIDNILAKSKGMNVISPTWFSIIREDGELASLASKPYVEKAHSKGVEVWGLVDDFSKEVDFYELFMKHENRKSLINNLLYFMDEYNLDGINIDFETVKADYAEGFVQFLREFSILMRKKGKVLSVDNFVPAAHTEFYNRKEQGIVADYVCVMAYDEHYYGSPEAGSVASLSWVRRGIDMTAEEVTKSKIIVGLPFYTRIWKVKENGTIETKALGMRGGAKRVQEAKIAPTWDEVTGQYYAEWKSGKDIYKIWLEEKRSIEAKLNEVDSKELAGVAFWKLGLERDDVWQSIANRFP